MLLGGTNQGQLEVRDERVVLREERQVDLDAFPDAGIREVVGHPVAIGWIREAPAEVGQVVLGPRVLNVGQQLPALPHQVQPPAEQVAGRSHGRGIHVRLRQQAAAEERRDL